MTITWELVGQPHAAIAVAVHFSGTLFALNEDRSLWRNEAGGIDTEWKQIDVAATSALGAHRLPPDVGQIAAGAGGLYFVTGMDRSLWVLALSHLDRAPARIDRMRSAMDVAAAEDSTLDFAHIWALNDDRTLWHNQTSGYAGGWHQVGQPFLARRIATSRRAVYMLDEVGFLWRSAGGGDLTWELLNPAEPLSDTIALSAATPEGHRGELLYALNRGGHLFRGQVP